MQGKNRNAEAVVKNGNIITSVGPATANVFALTIVKELCGGEKAQELYEELQMPSLKAYL